MLTLSYKAPRHLNVGETPASWFQELRLYIPDTSWPLCVTRAHVSCKHWDTFNVEFETLPVVSEFLLLILLIQGARDGSLRFSPHPPSPSHTAIDQAELGK